MNVHRPIMVIEDDTVIRRLIAEILIDAGHRVVECASGEEALTLLDESHPKLITLDLAMPSMDGVQFLRELQARTRMDPIPVVLVTAAPEFLRRDVAVEGYVAVGKPFRMEQLLSAVEESLGRSQTASRRTTQT